MNLKENGLFKVISRTCWLFIVLSFRFWAAHITLYGKDREFCFGLVSSFSLEHTYYHLGDQHNDITSLLRTLWSPWGQ
jgi:hypothetical protein